MKVFQVFESYPLFYQPYIPPVLDKLSTQIDSEIIAFEGHVKTGEKASVLPSYYYRKIYEKISQKLNKKYKNLNYLEILAIKQNVDVIHIQHSFLFNKIKNLLNRNSSERPKIVITLRGGDTYIKPWIQKRWRDFYKNEGNKVDAFIVMSEDQKQYLMRWGVSENNVKVIPISFGERFEVEPKLPNKDKLKLMSIFRMCWEKNIFENLRLIKFLIDSGVEVNYDIYGDGRDIGQVYYLRDKLGLENIVNIKGKVPNRQLKSKFIDYDFIVQLSHSESLGMSVIEAQTYGVPAIVSANGGLPEIIQHNINGIIIKNGSRNNIDDILELWKNDKLYKEYSANAIKISQQKYNTTIEVEKLLDLYRTLLKK